MMAMTERQRDAVDFLQSACRNWRTVPKLSYADLDDVADALERRDKQRQTITLTTPTPEQSA